jgi:hypothetical protein
MLTAPWTSNKFFGPQLISHLRSSGARPKNHIHFSGSPFNQRGNSVQFIRFTAHDADEDRAFTELQGFGAHGRNEVPFWQFGNFRKGFYHELIDGSELRREKNCQ